PVACHDSQGCVPQMSPSCTSGEFAAVPSLRLDAVSRALRQHDEHSICEPDWSFLSPGFAPIICSCNSSCIRYPLRDPADPDCVATDITMNEDGSVDTPLLPRCGEGVPRPCWAVEKKPECDLVSPQSVGFTVYRDWPYAPPHTTTQLECALPCSKVP